MKKSMVFKWVLGGMLFSTLLLGWIVELPHENLIRINQLGYYPHAPKMAVVISDSAHRSGASLFYILSENKRDTAFTGILGPLTKSTNSSLFTRSADFNGLTREGTYRVVVPGIGESYLFRIGKKVSGQMAAASLKAFYYQRSAMPLDAVYAGQWSRPAGHPDTEVLVHSSAASVQRPAGTIISSPGGWYDAGDYNKYIVNSGITMGTLLDAYEDFPAYFDTLHTYIPPIGSGIPDLLNESLYNLRWMLTMQDPADGGVYHKCTNAAFDGMVMPGLTKAPRYVVQKGTAGTLDFAAVMAQSGRILEKFRLQLPGLADSCMRAARSAWLWAEKNPGTIYDQQELNSQFTPPISTGAYGDRVFKDERFWAAAELWVNAKRLGKMKSETGNNKNNKRVEQEYEKVLEERSGDRMNLPSWGNVEMMGAYTLLRYHRILDDKGQTKNSEKDQFFLQILRKRLLQIADGFLSQIAGNAFHTPMGQSAHDFVWGSNAVAANQGMLLINAWLLTRDKKYIDNALANLDYLSGRNATGFCFVTGMGTYSPWHPHHRPSMADGIEPPVPGLLVGGPNPGRQDHEKYDLIEPETAYLDKGGAYASNEIAINWNAPLVYLSGALEALQCEVGFSK
ncbi:glycoside hydrolase family 9 protein [Flavitalea flava]